MHQETGIEREAIAFMLFMAMMAGLELAWSAAAEPARVTAGAARASAGLVTSELLIRDRSEALAAQTRKVSAPMPARPNLPSHSPQLAAFFAVRGSEYPPKEVTLIAVKDEGVLEVWAKGRDGRTVFIMKYPICGISGSYGPKLRRGDRQVPEGMYSIDGLNPYSNYHLSVRLDYPNDFDRRMAAADGRTNLGGDIYIHGDCRSMGCLAMGDEVIEELYALVRDTGTANVRVIIAPWDFRKYGRAPAKLPPLPTWTQVLYEDIAGEMARYRTYEARGVDLAMAHAATGSF